MGVVLNCKTVGMYMYMYTPLQVNKRLPSKFKQMSVHYLYETLLCNVLLALYRKVGKAAWKNTCLTHVQLKEELRTRKIYDFGFTKKDTKQKLVEALKGVQRVPSLLIHTPTQSIETLNLQNYTILECEPLHDIKGHLSNIFDALSSILEKEFAKRSANRY